MNDKPPPSSFDSNPEYYEENRWQKLGRRLKQEPLVPLGCAATCYALWRAYKSMKAGDSIQLNRMFRARIYAQAFTLVAVVAGGLYYKTERRQRQELERAIAERKSQEKRDAWLKELEIRDQEDKDWRERHAAIEKAAKEAEKVPGKELRVGTREKEVAESLAGGEVKKGGILDAVKAMVGGETK